MSVKPLTSANPSFALDLAARDCAPLQFVREFTVNAIEAIASRPADAPPSSPGLVVWRECVELCGLGAPKLCCIDTGCGMTPDELERHIGRMFSSGKTQSLTANYGQGAKCAGAKVSPAGITYVSWTGTEEGFTCTLRRDEDEGWGLHEDEHARAILPADPSLCPPEIVAAGYMGTMVVFHGDTTDSDTTQPPTGLGADWLLHAVNTRFLTLPDDVEVRCQRPREIERRRALGHAAHLEPFVVTRGTVDVTGARVHWYLLDGRHDLRRKSTGRFISVGHRCAIHDGEVYDLKSVASGGYRALQEFGIVSGYQQVALMIEPSGVSSDGLRGRLLVDDAAADNQLPYDRWADEFVRDMPQELRDHVARAAGQATPRDRRELLRQLQKIAGDMPIPAYRRDVDGDEHSAEATHGARQRTDARNPKAKTPSPGADDGPADGGDLISLFARPDGPSATPHESPIPEIRAEWVSVNDGSRVTDALEDLAASYISRVNLVQLNADFRGYTALLKFFVDRHSPEARPIIESEVRAACEDLVVEMIVGVLRLRSKPLWTTARVDIALSDEALTAHLMSHVTLSARVGERLNRRLRKAAA